MLSSNTLYIHVTWFLYLPLSSPIYTLHYSQHFMEQPLERQIHIASIIFVALTYIPGKILF